MRIASALVGAPLIIAFIWLGGYPFGLFVMLLSVVGLVEYFLPWPNKNIYPASGVGVAFGLSFPALIMIEREDLVIPVMGVMLAAALAWQMMRRRRTRTGVDAGVTVLGALYAGLLPSFLILARRADGGFVQLTAAVACVWACDVTAYFVGRAFGKKKLAEDISPHKTVAGAIAGVVAAMIAAVVFAAAGYLPWLQAISLGLIVGILAQIGDLVASTLKREVGIKDYSRTIPGHGGILDRFDGLFFVAPFVYLLFQLWQV